jgi:hypothetical protein
MASLSQNFLGISMLLIGGKVKSPQKQCTFRNEPVRWLLQICENWPTLARKLVFKE